MAARSFTKKKRERFIERLAETGSPRRAAEFACITPQWAYQVRKVDPEFAEAWADAERLFVDRLECEADRRAMEGVPRVKYFRGIPVGEEREYSDSLLMFRLKGLARERYRESQSVRHEGSVSVSFVGEGDLED